MPELAQPAADGRYQRPGETTALALRHDSHPVHPADALAIKIFIEPGRGGANHALDGVEQIALPFSKNAGIRTELLSESVGFELIFMVRQQMDAQPVLFVTGAIPPQPVAGGNIKVGN